MHKTDFMQLILFPIPNQETEFLKSKNFGYYYYIRRKSH